MPAPGAPNPSPPIRTSGFWIFKKKFCTQCEQQLDKTWDACPFCAQIAQQAAAAPAKLQKLKTMAMVLAICRALGTEPARTAVVGDTPADLAMGRSAGLGRVVGVLTGVGSREDLEPLADALLESVGELLTS